MKLVRRIPKRGRVEIIPMIDTILILLIFYMSFSQFEADEKRMDAKVGTGPAETPPVIKPVDVLIDIGLHVYNRDQILVRGGPVLQAQDLAVYMRQLAMLQQKGTVVIEAEPNAAYEDVVAVLDACALAKFNRVGLAPLPEPTAAKNNPQRL